MSAPEIARPAWQAGALSAVLFVAGWLLDGLLFVQGSTWTPAAWAVLAACLACFAGAITAFVFWCIRAWLREETDMTVETELTERARTAIADMQAADDNEGTTVMQALDAGQECADVLAQLLITTGHPAPEAVPRRLTTAERIEARHWLQVLSEDALSVRNAMDPQHGVLKITDTVWAGQWADLRKDLDGFTGRVRRGVRAATASPGAFQDRNG